MTTGISRDSRVFIAGQTGFACEPNIDDPRESPSFALIELLLARGARVCYHDPHIPVAPPMRSWPNLPALSSEPLSAELVASVDAVVLATDHTAVDYDLVARHAKLVVDTRGVYREARPNVVKA